MPWWTTEALQGGWPSARAQLRLIITSNQWISHLPAVVDHNAGTVQMHTSTPHLTQQLLRTLRATTTRAYS